MRKTTKPTLYIISLLVFLNIVLAANLTIQELVNSYDYDYYNGTINITNFQDRMEDRNSNGENDTLVIDLTSDQISGTYQVVIELFDQNGIIANQVDKTFSVSDTVASLEFKTGLLTQSQYNYSTAIYSDDLLVYRKYRTQTNSYANFENGGSITSISDHNINNGLIRFVIDLKFTEFTVTNVTLNVKHNETTLSKTIRDKALGSGGNIFGIDIDNETIKSTHYIGNFTIESLVVGDQIIKVNQNTSNYNYEDFAKTSYLKAFSDAAVDTNGNGLSEILELNFTINAKTAESYTVEAELYDESNNFVALVNHTEFLSTGEQVMRVSVNGSDIYSTRLNGPYSLSYVTLSKNNELTDAIFNTRTNEYFFTEFERPPQPDLTIDLQAIRSAQSTNLTLNLSNQGQVQALNVFLDLFDNASFQENISLPSLDAGDSIAYNFIRQSPPDAIYTAIADFDNVVDESNETNNIAQSEAVTSVTIDSFTVAVDNNTIKTFEFIIRNDGDLTLSNVTWQFEAGDGSGANSTEFSLQADQTKTVNLDHEYAFGNYTAQLTVTADELNVAESLFVTANATLDGQSCTVDSQCLSTFCDNDGSGLADDNWCFTPFNTYFDGQETTFCEFSTGSGVADCDERQPGDDLNTCVGLPYYADECSATCDHQDITTAFECTASGCSCAEPLCHGLTQGANITTCAANQTYFADQCTATAAGGDRETICRSSAFASGCTADSQCNDVAAGTNDCTLNCIYDPDLDPPSVTIVSPTNNSFFNVSSINLDWTTNEPLSSCAYSLNGGANVSICPGGVPTNTTITGTQGSNQLTIFAHDTSGNIGTQEVVFEVNVTEELPINVTSQASIGNINVTKDKFFPVHVNVSCVGDCGTINVSLDPAPTPVLVDGAATGLATAYGPNENMCVDNNGVIHAAWAASSADLWYGNSVDNGATWQKKELLSGSVSFVGILCAPDDTITVHYASGRRLNMFQSTDGGTTFTGPTALEDSDTFIQLSCTVDSGSVVHCCMIEYGADDLWYVNSSSINNGREIHSSDADNCDIAVDADDNVYIAVTDDRLGDDLDILSSQDGWTTRNQVGNGFAVSGSVRHAPSIAICNNGSFFVAWADNADLQFCEGSTADWTAQGTCQELDAQGSYFPDIAASQDCSPYILYHSASGLGDIVMANRTDGNWQARSEVAIDARYVSIADSLHPSSNRMADKLKFLYVQGDEVYFNTINISSTGGSQSSAKGGLISTTQGATPFYTNDSNPRTISLTNGQTKTVIFWVNATGAIGKTFDFFAFANVTSNLSISDQTEKWNVTIVAPIDPQISIDVLQPLGNINASQNEFFDVVVNVSCSAEDCGDIDVSLDPQQTNNLGASSKQWMIKYEQVDDVVGSLEVISDTDFIFTPSSLEYRKTSRPNYRWKMQIEYGKEQSVLREKMRASDFHKPIQFSIPPEVSTFTIHVGETSTLINVTSLVKATHNTPGENICRTPDGTLHVAWEGPNDDLSYATSTDEISWTTKTIFDDSGIEEVDVVCRPDGSIFVYFDDKGTNGNLTGMLSTDGGATFNKFMIARIGAATDYKTPSCVSDSNNIIHCAFSDGTRAYYVNSTSWGSETLVNGNSADDTDHLDIEVDSNNCPWIVGTGTDDDKVDVWSPCLNGWGDTNRVEAMDLISTSNTNHPPSIAIRNVGGVDVIGIAAIGSSDLQFCNSTTSHATTWSCQELDATNSFHPDIAISDSGDFHILYQGVGTGCGTSTDILYANSSDGSRGAQWSIRNTLAVDSCYASVASSRYPISNNLGNKLSFVYTSVSDGAVYYNNVTVPSNSVPEVILQKELVSDTIGATPFYTNESNPRRISLNKDESQRIIFWVNATGEINKTYEFFAFVNITSSQLIQDETSRWNVKIV